MGREGFRGSFLGCVNFLDQVGFLPFLFLSHQIRSEIFFCGLGLELEHGRSLITSVSKAGKGWSRAADCVLESRTAEASEANSMDVPQGTISDWALGPPEMSGELCEAQTTHALSCRDYS